MRVSDQEARYKQISKTLGAVNSPWKVGFEYLPEGVLCEGRWYPALKMEWVEATGLLPFVEGHLQDRRILADLALKFAGLVQDLSRHGIAHGDLQHGNILVTPSGELKLIDYDGMFVPGLDSFGASELGHANYQSPLRTGSTWGTGHRPVLQLGHLYVAQRAGFLWSADLTTVPPLEAILAPRTAAAAPAPAAAPASAATSADWLKQPGMTTTPRNGSSVTATQGTPAGSAAWVTTHLPAGPPADFARPPGFTRVVCALLVGSVVLFAVLAALGLRSWPAAFPLSSAR